VTAVFQDFTRFELPLRDNVAPAGAPDAAVRAALAGAGAADLAELDTVLARGYEGGTDLSGGQWQRVALARAMFALECGAGVLVLDEPTANLDVRAESALYERFLDLTAGLTTIVVSHRFSTVRRADRIVVLEGGRIVEAGSHDQLMALGGRYARMFDLQARYYADDAALDGLAPYEPVAEPEPEPEPEPAKPKRAKATRAAKPKKAVRAKAAPTPEIPAQACDEDDDWAGYEIEYADRGEGR